MQYNKINFQIAISALRNAHSDHYDGINAIYRLAAYVPLPKGYTPNEIRKLIVRLTKDFERLGVRPNRFNLLDEKIEIDFYPKGYQMVMNVGQYVGLVIQFADYLESTGHPWLFIQEGFYSDDPDETVKGVSNDHVNFFPEFNSTCFGAEDNQPIEIMNYVLLNNDMEVA